MCMLNIILLIITSMILQLTSPSDTLRSGIHQTSILPAVVLTCATLRYRTQQYQVAQYISWSQVHTFWGVWMEYLLVMLKSRPNSHLNYATYHGTQKHVPSELTIHHHLMIVHLKKHTCSRWYHGIPLWCGNVRPVNVGIHSPQQFAAPQTLL